MTDSSRPKSADFPSVWATFEGKQTINGAKRKYWIQDLTDEYKDELLFHMKTGFLSEEPLTKYTKLADDSESLQDIMLEWKKMMEQKVSLICLTKDKNGVTHLAGGNILGVTRRNDKKGTYKGKKSSIVFDAIYYIYGIKDLFSEVKADAFLNALGLYVLREYRGEGIGPQLLKARREISGALGLRASITVFTSTGGQKSAENAGFKDILEFPYKNLEKVNPLYKFPGIENDIAKSMKLMYIKYSD